jgi:hypothetical protein
VPEPTPSSPVSVAICRIASAVLALLGGLGFGLGIILFPPILESHFLVDGAVGSTLKTVAAGIVSFAVMGGAVATFFVAAQLWRHAPSFPERRVQLVLLAFAFTGSIVFVIFELTTRIAVPPAAYLSGDDFWIHRYVEAHKARVAAGDTAFQSEFPMDRFDPELGWAPREGFRSEEVNVNSRGVRGLVEDPETAPEGTRRIVIIGDSFTFGEGVADADSYTAILETLLDDVRVINLGVLGFGTDQQLLRLRREAFQFRPDLVILGFFGPNVDRNVLTFRDAAKPMFVLAGDGLALVNSPVPGPEVEWDNPLPWLRSFAWAGTLAAKVVDRTPFAPKWEVTRRILDEIDRACRDHGVPLMVAFYPDKEISFVAESSDTEIVVERWAGERDVRFFSIRPAFSKLVQKERAKIFYGHWTPYGNRLVASLLAAELSTLDF